MRRAEVDRWGAEREEAKRTGVDIERIKLNGGKKEGQGNSGKNRSGIQEWRTKEKIPVHSMRNHTHPRALSEKETGNKHSTSALRGTTMAASSA